jgi:hypothetical protein
MVIAGILVPAAWASVPSVRRMPGIPELNQTVLQSVDAQKDFPSAGTHPFFNEFYLQQFAAEPTPAIMRGQRSSWFSPVLTPVTSAASNLSHHVASWRRALVRLMP